ADVKFLDLFAGSGMIGFEALSRGVQFVTAVEKNNIAVKGLKRNKEKLGVQNYEVFVGDAQAFIKYNKESYQIIFADPPFQYAYYKELINQILSSTAFAENALLIVEHDKFNNFTEHPNFSEIKKYGSVHFSFFTLKN